MACKCAFQYAARENNFFSFFFLFLLLFFFFFFLLLLLLLIVSSLLLFRELIVLHVRHVFRTFPCCKHRYYNNLKYLHFIFWILTIYFNHSILRVLRQHLTMRTKWNDRKYLTIIPQARMGYESIAHEAEGRMGY